MVTVTANSPLCIRIVLVFLDFLTSVQGLSGAESRALEIACYYLKVAFNLNETSVDQPPKGLLLNLFSSLPKSEPKGKAPELGSAQTSTDTPSTSMGGCASVSGLSVVELYTQYINEVVESFFSPSTFGRDDDDGLLYKLDQIFDDSLTVMKRLFMIRNVSNLTLALSILANEALEMKKYAEAVDLFSCCIALAKDSAKYLCNRAFGLRALGKYNEAKMDCQKSIEIDPKNTSAYYSLGLANYEMGNYVDAICKGFAKGLEINSDDQGFVCFILTCCQKLKDKHFNVAFQELRDGYYQLLPTQMVPEEASFVPQSIDPEKLLDTRGTFMKMLQEGEDDGDTISLQELVDALRNMESPSHNACPNNEN